MRPGGELGKPLRPHGPQERRRKLATRKTDTLRTESRPVKAQTPLRHPIPAVREKLVPDRAQAGPLPGDCSELPELSQGRNRQTTTSGPRASGLQDGGHGQA